MTEIISKDQSEDAVALATNFLHKERRVRPDGIRAAADMSWQIQSTSEIAGRMLRSNLDENGHFYRPLYHGNVQDYDLAVTALAGHIVLMPAGKNVFPAVVSPESDARRQLRLHVLCQPYTGKLGQAATLLSAAAQSETANVGVDNQVDKNADTVEVEHFTTLLAASADPNIAAAWSRDHVNHKWRAATDQSVLSNVWGAMAPAQTRATRQADILAVPQRTLTVSREQIASGSRSILWLESLAEQEGLGGRPAVADNPNALLVVQGLGLQALKNVPSGQDTLKRLIEPNDKR